MRQEPSNPLYWFATFFGVAFTVTAVAFCVLMLHSSRLEGPPAGGQSGAALMGLLAAHGTEILIGELAGLGVFTIAAIRLDHVRGERIRAERRRASESTGLHEANTEHRTPNTADTR